MLLAFQPWGKGCYYGSIIGISILSFTVLFNWSASIAAIPLFLLFIARLIDGLSGGTAATATTILADISSPEKRAKTFGLIGVAFGLSFFLGNIFVVIFAKNTNNNFIIPVLIASFGFAVMGRISLLIGRFNDLILFSGPSYDYGTFWMLGFIIAVLAYWSFKNPEKQEV